MKVSWRWLSEMIDLSSTSPNDLANLLTIVGFEVENVETIENQNIKDSVFDIASTSHRNDVVSIIRLAREVSVLLKQKLSFSSRNLSFLSTTNNKNIIKFDPFPNYHYHLGILFSNIIIDQSPKWIQNKLKLASIKSINSIIDIKNYILLKWGQTIELYDISAIKVSNQSKIIKDCLNKNSINTNYEYYKNEISTTIDNDTSIRTVNTAENFIAGTNKSTSIHTMLLGVAISHSQNWPNISNTANVLHSSFPNPKNSCDKNILYCAVQEATFLYTKFCKGKVQDYISFDSMKVSPIHIKVMKKNLIRILGPISHGNQLLHAYELRVTNILNLLNLSPISYPSYWLVTIPKFRINDLMREIDIIEEIGRMYGFNHFMDILPSIAKKGKLSQQELLQRQIRFSLKSFGLHELIHHSLVANNDNNMNIYNPLSEECSSLRISLVKKLINSAYYNIQQGNDGLEGFEIGKIFCKLQKTQVIREELHLAAIFGGNSHLRFSWLDKSQPISWFQAKGLLTNLCQAIGVSIIWKVANQNSCLNYIFHIQRIADLYISQKKIGIFGEINPLSYYNIDIKKRLYAFELNLDMISEQTEGKYFLTHHIKSYSRYPHVIRDISIIIPRKLSISHIVHAIESINNPLIKSIELINEYSGEQIPSNQKSVSLRLKYQASDKTLTNIQVTQLDKKIKSIIQEKLNIKICLRN